MMFNITVSSGEYCSILVHFIPNYGYKYDINSLIVSPPTAVIFVFFIVTLFKKYWHKLEPVHVFELNTLVDMAIILIVHFFNQLDVFLPEQSAFCALFNFLVNWSVISFFADFSLGQIDKVRTKIESHLCLHLVLPSTF